MLNDSGPIFPAPNATYNSRPLHDLITTQWNLASLYSQLPASFNPNDFGSINAHGRDAVPERPLAYTGYSSDYNFSRFSYERFYPGITQASVLPKWRADQTNLINQIKNYSNYSYHVPWHRPINDSHCSSIITFIGSHACPTHAQEVLVRGARVPVDADLEVPERQHAVRDLPRELAHQQPAEPRTRRAGEQLQQRGSRACRSSRR